MSISPVSGCHPVGQLPVVIELSDPIPFRELGDNKDLPPFLVLPDEEKAPSRFYFQGRMIAGMMSKSTSFMPSGEPMYTSMAAISASEKYAPKTNVRGYLMTPKEFKQYLEDHEYRGLFVEIVVDSKTQILPRQPDRLLPQ